MNESAILPSRELIDASWVFRIEGVPRGTENRGFGRRRYGHYRDYFFKPLAQMKDTIG